MPLLVCATPIGNLGDVTVRVLEALGEADLVLCEDTRRTRLLLHRHGVDARALRSYHEHNERRRIGEVLPLLRGGATVCLVSDAGLPGVSDPGARLVDAALREGLAVSVLPGPSAVETALVASGLVPADTGYRFVGFLPRRPAELERLWAEIATAPYATVAFESPRRLPAAIAWLAAAEPSRRVAVCRELTKRFEEVTRGAAGELAPLFAEPVKGEVTLVIAAAEPEAGKAGPAAASAAAVIELVDAGVPRRRAAAIVAGLTGEPVNALYRSGL